MIWPVLGIVGWTCYHAIPYLLRMDFIYYVWILAGEYEPVWDVCVGCAVSLCNAMVRSETK